MKVVVVPGINGLGITKGVEKSYVNLLETKNFDKIDLDIQNISKQLDQILEKSKKYFEEDKVLFFGGDHSISFPLVSNFFNKCRNNARLLIFDAHLDLMTPMKEPGHEEWLRALVEAGFNCENILIIGVRRNSINVDISEINYAKEKGIKIIFVDEFEEKKQEILNFVRESPLYVSFDIDVFDSSLVTSTGYAEKQGLGEKQIFGIIEKIKPKINFFDLVEINLDKGSEIEKQKTIDIARKLLKTLGVE